MAAGEGWEMINYARLQCPSALMAFVSRSMCASHLAIGKAVLKAVGIDGVMNEKERGVVIKWSAAEEGNWTKAGFT